MATDIDRIARINELKDEAREAYNAGNYEKALEHYRFLVDSMKVMDDKIMLNMANALYQLQDTAQAINSYQSVSDSPDKLISSVAHQQLGILSNRTGNAQEALEHFKQALRKDPSNEDARYNYELLKKVLDEQQKKQEEEKRDEQKDKQDKKDEQGDQEEQQQDQQQKQDQNKEGEQENKEQKEQSEQGKEEEQQEQKDSEQTEEGEEKEKSEQEKEGNPENQEEQDEQKNEARQKEIAERLKDMKISEEKARMILEAMKNNEIQYIQQNKRKATQKKDSSKPDW